MHFFKNYLKPIFPFLIMIAVIVFFHYTDLFFVKYYPPLMNFLLFVIFFSSLFQDKTIIQKFVLASEPDADECIMQYTRRLTVIWSFFMFINFLVSFCTVYMSEKIWALYNGGISYLLVGLIFGVEYIIRINFKRKHGRS